MLVAEPLTLEVPAELPTPSATNRAELATLEVPADEPVPIATSAAEPATLEVPAELPVASSVTLDNAPKGTSENAELANAIHYSSGSGQLLIGALPVGLPSLSTGTFHSATNAVWSAAFVIEVSMLAQAVLTAVR